MALSIGIVGLPNVGKSTLFNALTDADVLAANYPFATIEPNTGIVPLPDPRLSKLAQIYKTDKIVPATVTFLDIAGLVEGASTGEGLGNQFLAHIRSCSAICHVVRAFKDSNVQNTGTNSPANDISIINTELALADLQTINNRLPRLQKEAKADPKLKTVYESGLLAKQLLEAGTPLSKAKSIELGELKDLQLLTAKPVIYVFNVGEQTLLDESEKESLAKIADPAEAIFISAKLESELRGLDASDRAELLASYGQSSSGLDQLTQAAYKTLGLQSFLTAGEKEVHAWTIPSGSTAPQAAGAIHSDFERGFVAAQVMDYNDLTELGSEAAVKAAGKLRTEGKGYVMQPNDVVEFRFNL